MNKLNQHTNRIGLSIVLGYADDLIVITEEEKDLTQFLETADSLMGDDGLQINYMKSCIMASGPSNTNILEAGKYIR